MWAVQFQRISEARLVVKVLPPAVLTLLCSYCSGVEPYVRHPLRAFLFSSVDATQTKSGVHCLAFPSPPLSLFTTCPNPRLHSIITATTVIETPVFTKTHLPAPAEKNEK